MKNFLRQVSFILLVTACGGAQQSASSLPVNPTSPNSPTSTSALTYFPAGSIVYYNGTVVTMDEPPIGTALWVEGDRIGGVGSDAEMLAAAGDDAIAIDLQGAVIFPGFIDSHTHRISQRFKWGFESVAQASEEALSQGWATLNELAVDEGMLSEFVDADSRGELSVRVNCYLMANTFEGESLGEWWTSYEPGQQVSPHVRIAGIKIFIDFNSGRELLWEQSALNEFVRRWQDAGWQITMKAIGQQSHDLALTAYEYALGGQSNHNFRHRLEHSLAMNPGQIARAARMGIILSIQPSFPGVIWHEEDIRNLTAEEGQENIFRFRDYSTAGLQLVASPYNPDGINAELTEASHVSPIGLLYRSVTQVGLGSQPPENWMLEQNLSVDQMLPMLTINGAYAARQESEIGSLTPGKLADLVILSANPLDGTADELFSIETLMTMVGSSIEYCAEGHEGLCSTEASSESSETEELFTGFWQGIDSDDGSVITVALTQDATNLTGRFEDTFSGDVPPPGYEGEGSGTVISDSTADMIFNLTRSDGRAVNLTFSMVLTDENQSLILTSGDGYVIVLQRQ